MEMFRTVGLTMVVFIKTLGIRSSFRIRFSVVPTDLSDPQNVMFIVSYICITFYGADNCVGATENPILMLKLKRIPSVSGSTRCPRSYLPPANEVWGKVIFLHLSVILFTGGACVVAGGCAWLPGACMVAGGVRGSGGACVVTGGMHGCWGACMVAGGVCMVAGGHAWLLGGMHGCRGVCVVLGGMRGCRGGVHGCRGGGVRRIRRDTVNERAVRILLECILVFFSFAGDHL